MQKTSLNDVIKALEKIDISLYQVVFIHSSLFQLGQIKFTLSELLDVLIDWVGPERTVAMPAFSYHNEPFIPWWLLKTPGKTGLLTESFRKRKGVLRSAHPIHSVTAFGNHAEYLTRGVSETSFGESSTFAKLIGMNALNLALGAEFIGGATFLHYSEERVQVPYREFIPLNVTVFGSNDEKIDAEFFYYARKKPRLGELEYENCWNIPLQDMVNQGLFHFDKIGLANLMWSPMGETTNFLLHKLEQNPYYCAKEKKSGQ